LKLLPPTFWPFFSFSLMSGSPTADISVGTQSSCATTSFNSAPGSITPGQRTRVGTREPPSQFVFVGLLLSSPPRERSGERKREKGDVPLHGFLRLLRA
jgi:hypothetical protein